MNRTIFVGSLILGLSTIGVRAVRVTPQERTLTIPISGPAASVRCEYFVDLERDQPKSGARDWGRVATQPGSVVINTAPVGAPTTRLNLAFVYCPGFAISVLRDQAIPGPVVQLAPLKPLALPTVKLKGRVPIASLGNLAGSIVEVRHYAGWITESYGVWDGSIPQFQIGTVPLAADGTFSVDLPDLAGDPWVSLRRSHGWFRLTAKIRGTEYLLQPPAALNAVKWLDDQGLAVPPGSADLSITFTVKPIRR